MQLRWNRDPYAYFRGFLALALTAAVLALTAMAAALLQRFYTRDTVAVTVGAVDTHFEMLFDPGVFTGTLADAQRFDRMVRMHLGIYDIVDTRFISPDGRVVYSYDPGRLETAAAPADAERLRRALAGQLGVPDRDLGHLFRGALLHDVGKIAVPDAILRKPGPLTDAEWAEMRRHPTAGHSILRDVPFLQEALPTVLHHHERWDGSGYPAGLAGEDIPLGARIFAVIDTLDAITSDRPYRAARSLEDARQEIRRCAGTQFDPRVVDAFLAVPAAEWLELRRLVADGRMPGVAAGAGAPSLSLAGD